MAGQSTGASGTQPNCATTSGRSPSCGRTVNLELGRDVRRSVVRGVASRIVTIFEPGSDSTRVLARSTTRGLSRQPMRKSAPRSAPAEPTTRPPHAHLVGSYVGGAVVTSAIGLLVAFGPAREHATVDAILGFLMVALGWLPPIVAIAWVATGRPAFIQPGWRPAPYVASAATLAVAAVAIIATLVDR